MQCNKGIGYAFDARFDTHESPREIQEHWVRTYDHGTFLNCGMEEFNPKAFPRSGKPIKWRPETVLLVPPMMAVPRIYTAT
jgi:hypothetical protein